MSGLHSVKKKDNQNSHIKEIMLTSGLESCSRSGGTDLLRAVPGLYCALILPLTGLLEKPLTGRLPTELIGLLLFLREKLVDLETR